MRLNNKKNKVIIKSLDEFLVLRRSVISYTVEKRNSRSVGQSCWCPDDYTKSYDMNADIRDMVYIKYLYIKLVNQQLTGYTWLSYNKIKLRGLQILTG